jgi:signal peptidase II
MAKLYIASILAIIGVIIVDQSIKTLFIEGLRYDGECISGVLTYNRGVAFSMFAFLEENLKWIQIVILGGVIFYIIRFTTREYYLPASLIIGAGISNIMDRFNYGGVVDYVYWHCWFDFAIFNLADVIIDIGVAWILVLTYLESRREKEES